MQRSAVRNQNDDSDSSISDWSTQNSVRVSPPKRKRIINRSSKQRKKVSTSFHFAPENKSDNDWMKEVIPWRMPYFPQMGDEIIYFHQGHTKYLEAMKEKYGYIPSSNELSNTKDQELCKIVGIRYTNQPLKLCCLKLAIIDQEGSLTGETLSIKYVYIPELHDFLVLRQVFDTAIVRSWKLGDRFRQSKNHHWQFGKVLAIEPLDKKFPNSVYLSVRVRLDNGDDLERLSPWELEPVDESNLPEVAGNPVPVLPKDIRKFLYRPSADEWPMRDRGLCCRRLWNYLDQVTKLPAAEPFVNPVDVKAYPTYAQIVEYPVPLSMIKARLEQRFYRQIAGVKFDIRYILKNAEKFNEPGSQIVKQARLITEICLRIITDIAKDLDVASIANQVARTLASSESEKDSQENINGQTSTDTSDRDFMSFDCVETPLVSPERRKSAARKAERFDDPNLPSTSSAVVRSPRKSSPRKSSPRKSLGTSDWQKDCERILKKLWKSEDAEPFRVPVDILKYPDYMRFVKTPVSLQDITEQLDAGGYRKPKEFHDDVMLIFENSRNYNTKESTRVCKNTTRLEKEYKKLIKPSMERWSLGKWRNSKGKKAKSNGKKQTTARHGDRSSPLQSPPSSSSSSSDDDLIDDPSWDPTESQMIDDTEEEYYSQLAESSQTTTSGSVDEVADKISQISTAESASTVIYVSDDESSLEFVQVDERETRPQIRNSATFGNASTHQGSSVRSAPSSQSMDVDLADDEWDKTLIQVDLDQNSYE